MSGLESQGRWGDFSVPKALVLLASRRRKRAPAKGGKRFFEVLSRLPRGGCSKAPPPLAAAGTPVASLCPPCGPRPATRLSQPTRPQWATSSLSPSWETPRSGGAGTVGHPPSRFKQKCQPENGRDKANYWRTLPGPGSGQGRGGGGRLTPGETTLPSPRIFFQTSFIDP